ncbi:Lysophospholipase L1 [Arthrobacter alpinus]|uniref:Lysophospholipase L1 n=1 Tax=Arthrobacter alpinus TaxID=656366 RepID=A0A1H5E3B9_9MICC|nr:SGNH/GDSL hydrolase family protein [Arthrobacter alpinus]SED85647.1 Lysophospholipase L1 [Arthrobacter alpinus]
MVRGSILRVLVTVAAISVGVVGMGPSGALPRTGGISIADAAPEATPTASAAPTIADRNAVPDGGRAQAGDPKDEVTTIWDLPAGSLILNPVSGRQEVIDPEIARSAVLIGDSQSAGALGVKPADTWVERGLSARGYKVQFMGAGGIGFTATTSWASNYPDSLESGKMILPYGNPALVVVQGGGNDASAGASDAAILSNAERLLRALKASYPESKFLFIGTLARGNHAGGRRTEVDTLLAGFAQRNGVPFVSAGDWLTRYGMTNKMADGVHLTASGHKELSQVLASELKALGLQGPNLTR